jgi:hypothetical protein
LVESLSAQGVDVYCGEDDAAPFSHGQV